jgi:16S rRNA (adenine1518-N6/adenine1519-N6)-dimethyltransferase
MGSEKQHRPRKRFGQNFLTDQTVLERMARVISPASYAAVIEIGPGKGALTKFLIAQAQRLDVIEIDRDLAQLLRDTFTATHFSVHEADVLQFDFDTLLQQPKPVCVVGNLPYNISTPLLFKLFTYSQSINSAYFLLQKEVVDRLCAQPGSKQYGRLTVMAEYFCSAERQFDVPPSSFSPPPKVNSSFVRLTPHHSGKYQVNDYEAFAVVVRDAFNHRRKTLKRIFKRLVTDQQWAAIEIDGSARPENLSIQDFIRLSNTMGLTKSG